MKSRLLFVIFCALFLFVTVSVVAQEEKKGDAVKAAATKAAAAPDTAKGQTPVALTMEAIQELENRKNSLDARERQLDERARDLDIQEKLLKEKLRRMEELNKKMADRLETFKKDHEQKIAKLVSVVETMKPQAAAEYVENLDPDLAVAILARIQVARAAKIMNLVDKKKSARLTELYTGYRDDVEAPAATTAPAPASVPANPKEVPPANTKM